jgi:hypothetical protein
MLSVFGNERVFILMKTVKSRTKTRLTDEHVDWWEWQKQKSNRTPKDYFRKSRVK